MIDWLIGILARGVVAWGLSIIAVWESKWISDVHIDNSMTWFIGLIVGFLFFQIITGVEMIKEND